MLGIMVNSNVRDGELGSGSRVTLVSELQFSEYGMLMSPTMGRRRLPLAIFVDGLRCTTIPARSIACPGRCVLTACRLALLSFVVGEFNEAGSNRVIKKVTGGPVVPGDSLPEGLEIDDFLHVVQGGVVVAAK
jgi:hypothetical protein